MAIKSINLQEHNRLLKLQKLSSLLLGAKSSKEVSSIIINEGFEALDSLCGDVSIIDPQTKDINILAKRGYPEEIVRGINKVARRMPLLTIEAIESKKPIFIQNSGSLSNKYIFAREFQQKTNSQSTALIPLLVRGNAFGVLQFTFPTVQKFTPEDKNFMMYLADQCAQALDRIIALENEKKAKGDLAIILKSVDDAVIVRNAFGKITYVNPKALSMHGFTKLHEMVGLPLENYYNLFSNVTDEKGNSVDLDNIPFSEVFQKRESVKRILFKTLRKNNASSWIKVTSTPIFNNDGSISQVVSVIHDVTEEKQRDNSKDEFFGIASHELKTPVTSLKAYAQLLEKRFRNRGDNQAASLLQKMDFQIDKLTNLIRDLLDITKIEAGRMSYSNELFECNMLVDEVVEQMRLVTNGHAIVLEKTGDTVLLGDKERIGQVITNFLSNAIKYSPENGNIIVKVKKTKQDVTLSVQDFGVGIADGDQEHVFERFYREKNLKGDTFPGLGLGLYIASQIIARHGGKIGVKSKKGKGSTFFFSLPRYHK